MANKVEFFTESPRSSQIKLNGRIVGHLDSGGGMTWVTFNENGDRKVVARFKYKSPKTSAKHWLKFILQCYTPSQLIDLLSGPSKTTPMQLAKEQGYVSYNALQAQKESDKFFKARNAAQIPLYMQREG